MMKIVILCCLVMAAAAEYGALYGAPLLYSPYTAPYNYRGPLSLAPGQPASILGSDGRPLDTLDVNLDRSAHYAAKSGLHFLKKRSAQFIAPYGHFTLPTAPVYGHGGAIISPVTLPYSTHYTNPAHLPLGLRQVVINH